jgi:hypothetical protein
MLTPNPMQTRTTTDREAFNAARTNGAQSLDLTQEAKDYAGNNWKYLTDEERESIKADIEKDYYRSTHF